MTSPVAVLPDGNVEMSSGDVLDGRMIDSTAKASNMNATPVKSLSNTHMLLNNGNVVTTNAAQNSQPAMPVSANGSGVQMSNGTMVGNHTLTSLPSINNASDKAIRTTNSAINMTNMAARMNASSSNSAAEKYAANDAAYTESVRAAAAASAIGDQAAVAKHSANAQVHYQNRQAIASGGHCTIAPPSIAQSARAYCEPAPFTSRGSQSRYFRVDMAYGTPAM